jgi:hypothetical protein
LLPGHQQEEGEIKQEGRSKGAGFNLTQERVLDLHNHRPLVMYAVGAHMSDLAYANDPATDISSRRWVRCCRALCTEALDVETSRVSRPLDYQSI